ncbi:hypothetical protein LCGC14_0970630 [marine sediment metagenome]|uniref:Uncharacterized protein n=1 Tax=marine sediment metagenome TaxID=412755 RepID=A0A0F9QUW7_9ZZZZ
MSKEITQERAEAVGEAIKFLVEACNTVTEDELTALLHVGSMKHVLDPMIDPTRYRVEGPSITQCEKVLRAFLAFKQEVKGIGYFR